MNRVQHTAMTYGLYVFRMGWYYVDGCVGIGTEQLTITKRKDYCFVKFTFPPPPNTRTTCLRVQSIRCGLFSELFFHQHRIEINPT